MRKTEPAHQVGSEQGKKDDPQTQENLAVQQVPSIGQIGHREELERESQFQKAQTDFYGIHPTATTGYALQPCGEHGKKGEGQSQRNGKAQHTHRWRQEVAGCGNLHQKEADNGAGTGETDEAEGEGHQEYAQEAGRLPGLAIHSIAPTARQCQLECAEEAEGKSQQQQEKEDVDKCVRTKSIQGAGTKQERYDQSQSHIDNNDADAVNGGVPDSGPAILAPLHKETDRHGNNGPYARGEQGDETS